jgi:hypothetical protein
MKKYFLHNGTDSIGPFDKKELKQLGIVKTTPVWVEGKERWTCAENYEDLHELFFNTPPPITPHQKPKNRIWMKKAFKWFFGFFVIACITAVGIVTYYEVSKEEDKLVQQEQKQEAEQQTRNTITTLVVANTNEYTSNGLGGISNLDITITNNTNYILDEVMVEVEYIKKNGGIFNVEKLVMKNINPNDTKSLRAPDSNRGKTVRVSIKSIYSKQLNLCYDNNKPIIPGNPDPFICKN